MFFADWLRWSSGLRQWVSSKSSSTTAALGLYMLYVTTHITSCFRNIDPPRFPKRGQAGWAGVFLKAVMQPCLEVCPPCRTCNEPQGSTRSRLECISFTLLWPGVTAGSREKDVYMVKGYYVRWEGTFSALFCVPGFTPRPSSPLGSKSIGRSCSCEARQRHELFSARSFIANRPSSAQSAPVLGILLVFLLLVEEEQINLLLKFWISLYWMVCSITH